MAITPMGIIHRIHTTRGRPFSGTTGTAFLSGTALSRDILIAFIGRLTGVESTELARSNFEPALICRKSRQECRKKNCRLYFFEFGDCAGFVAGLLVGWSIWNSFFSC